MAAREWKRVVSRTVGLVGITVVLASLVLTSHAQESPQSGKAADRETWLAVAPGRVEPWSGEIRIGSAGIGRVAEVFVKLNDTVFPGEPLLRLDNDEVRGRHAKAAVQYNLRKRSRPRAEARGSERRKLEDALYDAERSVIEARTAVDRAAAARRVGSGSQSNVETARARLSKAKALVEQRNKDLAEYEADAAVAAPTDSDQQIAMARVDLSTAEAALDNLIVRAPIAATVLQINVRPGELASPSAPQPLIVLGDLTKLRVRAELDERDYGKIKVGHNVIVRSPAFPRRDIAGTVSSVAPVIEASRIGARGQRSLTDVSVAQVIVDLVEPGPLAAGMKVDVYFTRGGEGKK
jgi:HlyD family secretion protein